METSRMTNKRGWMVAAPLVVFALCIYASHTYEEHETYRAGAYIGRSAFTTADYQNRVCLSSFQRRCEVNDLTQDSVMENALASAAILPSISNVAAIHRGFRDGWREARADAFASRVK